MPKLVIKSGAAQIQEFKLMPGPNYAGRAFDNDFIINDPSVSGSHAEISMGGGKIIVKDLGSTNGTFIDRAPITESPLQLGQSLRFGAVEMFLEADASDAIAIAASTPPSAHARAPRQSH
jgi:predicted component of type VI protein secretion system